jgi:hypothetical protein
MGEPKTMTDNMGAEVPAKYVKPYDRVRDKRVRAVLARFQKARKDLEKLVADSLVDIKAIQDERLKELKQDATEKGNFSCTSFDGLVEVVIEQSYMIRLDDRVRKAREMMMDYARGLVKGADKDGTDALLSLIEGAFEAGASGNLPVARVLSLCRRDIKAAVWLEAKKLLMDSMSTERGRAYLRVRTRPSLQHAWENIRLDIADCWPLPPAEGGTEIEN